MSKPKPFGELSEEVRSRPDAAEEIDARKRAIVAAVRLNELRKQRGQTQAQLADLLGMTQANVSRMPWAVTSRSTRSLTTTLCRSGRSRRTGASCWPDGASGSHDEVRERMNGCLKA